MRTPGKKRPVEEEDLNRQRVFLRKSQDALKKLSAPALEGGDLLLMV
jgi:hypothetical protein